MQWTLLFALFSGVALAAPAPSQSQPRGLTFALPRMLKAGIARNGTKEMIRAYSKFGWNITQIPASAESVLGGFLGDLGFGSGTASAMLGSGGASATKSTTAYATASATASATATTSATASGVTSSKSAATVTGEVTATPADDDAEYLAQVIIGGQTVSLDFDTGSADLWVFSSLLPESQIGQHSVYDPSKSSSWSKLNGASFELSYGDGSGAAGIVGYDKVVIGQATVTSQAVECATSVSASFVDDAASDGLVGLGFSVINSVKPTPQQTFFGNIMSQLEQPVFTADLDINGDGTYEFGVIDESKYSGSLSYVDIDSSSGYWQFESPSYSIAGTVITAVDPSPAIADTGTSLLLLDAATVLAYYSQVIGATLSPTEGGYVYPCSATLPDFAIAVGSNYMVELSGSDLTYAEVDSTICFGGIQSNAGAGLQVFGDMLLQRQFVVFDGGNVSLGMAPKA